MKATTKLLAVAALAAGTIAMAADVQAARGGGGGGGGASRGGGGGGASRGGGASWNGGSRGGSWSGGSHGGNWSGGGHHGGWSGHGHGHGWHGSYYWGVPVFWGSYWGGYPYWGYPYWGYPYYGYDYYPNAVVYRESEPYPAYPEGRMGPSTTEVPRGEGAPVQGPLYMNYCESSKAYFPKVTTCAEGWKLRTPTQ